MKGVRQSDVFILITDEAGTGMHSGLGGAISHFIDFETPIIYVIGNHLTNNFFFHSVVRRRKTIEEVIKELKELS